MRGLTGGLGCPSRARKGSHRWTRATGTYASIRCYRHGVDRSPLRDDLRVHVDAGQVRVMLVDRDGHRLPNSPSAVLNILAANVDEAEMSHMLERIALLAVSAASHTTAIMPLPSVEPLGESMPGLGAAGAAHHMRLVSQLLELYDTLRISWDVIGQKPLKSMTTRVRGPTGRNTMGLLRCCAVTACLNTTECPTTS